MITLLKKIYKYKDLSLSAVEKCHKMVYNTITMTYFSWLNIV